MLEGPGELRPICLSSAVSKLFARLLLTRTADAFKYKGHAQTMRGSRQPTDYVWAVHRVLQLECEWKAGLWAVEVDVRKAFDTLNRNVSVTG